LQAALVRQNRV